MKQMLIAAMAGTTAFGAHGADGTFAASSSIDGVRQFVYDVDGTTKLATANGAVQFLFNGSVVGTGTYGFWVPGLFSAGTISIPGQAGNTVAITIEVWDKTTAPTYEQAMGFVGNFLPAQTVFITLGGAGRFPDVPASLTGFTGGKLLHLMAPEPSAIALAALGLGGLLFVSRRK